MTYALYYWHPLPGRGEFVRLLLEHGNIAYDDVARERHREDESGFDCIQELLNDADTPVPAFAPPVLRVDGRFIAQTASICDYLGRIHGHAGADALDHATALQHQLTIMDLAAEVHETHHPTATSLRYEDQKEAAVRRAAFFLSDRLPKFLGYFERVLERADAPFLLGAEPSYADLSLFHAYAGVSYAFPKGTAAIAPSCPLVQALSERVRALPNVARYLASERRLPFSTHGIFRHYPELDATG